MLKREKETELKRGDLRLVIDQREGEDSITCVLAPMQAAVLSAATPTLGFMCRPMVLLPKGFSSFRGLMVLVEGVSLAVRSSSCRKSACTGGRLHANV